LGYDDATQQAIQASGGGAAATVEEALARFSASRQAPGQIDEVDGYVWEVLPTDTVAARGDIAPASLETGTQDDGFAALAGRRVILAEMARNRAGLDQLPVLDQIHRLAVEQGIVTPYSSMLVLVNDSQQRLLDELMEMEDRYQREVENVGQTASATPFAVTGVPEPEEWLLLITAGLALVYAAWRRLAQKGAVA
jgi:putative PEP-CTERM system integral membrane protein